MLTEMIMREVKTMKALWIINSPIGTAAKILGYDHAPSGTWIATAEQCLKALLPNLRIDYAVCGFQDRTIVAEDHTVYELKERPNQGHRSRKSSVKKWEKIIKQEDPALIHIWGTEHTNALDVIDSCEGIPVIVTIQGIIASLAKYSKSDVMFNELMKGHRIAALPAYFRAKQRMKNLRKQVKYEREILSKVDGILIDNDWSMMFCNEIAPTVEKISFPLAINPIFEKTQWHIEKCEKNTIFTIAPSTEMKGTHMLLKALSIVKRYVPGVKLRIPGSLPMGRMAMLTSPPYSRYLKRLIRELGLEENVVFCGKLTSEQMAQELSRANVFAMPSKAENISTSLREAMWVGIPCVTALVGSLHEIARHNENALCYRYEEYELLAYYILEILNDDCLAEWLGKSGRNTIKNRYPMDQPLVQCAQWYERVSRR